MKVYMLQSAADEITLREPAQVFSPASSTVTTAEG
jgi:hypothetical protein